MENEKWGKKEKEEEEGGKGSWGVEHHDIAARSFFFKKRRWHDEMHSHRGLAKKASGRRDETGHNRWI